VKILLYTEIYDCGGADTFIANLINHWPDADDEFVVVANHNYPGIAIIEKNLKRPCKIVRHKMALHFNFIKKTERLGFISKALRALSPVILVRYAFFIYNIFMLRKILLMENNPDRLMVINGGYPGADSCRAAGISWGIFSKKPYSIHNYHNLAKKPIWFFLPHEYIIDRLLTRFTKVYVTVSRTSAESMSIRPIIYRKSRPMYIYNGIDIMPEQDRADYGNVRSELGIADESPLCLILATYEPRKGHYFLFKAFKIVLGEVPNAHLLVCGYGFPDEVKQVRKYVDELELNKNVHLMDFRSDISNLLLNTDVLLVSSQSFESFGFTSVEAMAHHVPVVATNIGGIPEVVVNNEGGYCVDSNDTNAFAESIIKLLKDENLRKEQGNKGFQRYKKYFTAKRMAKEYAALIKSQ
jgi:glycosyltransferase involved in cell wall biosynthesis